VYGVSEEESKMEEFLWVFVEFLLEAAVFDPVADDFLPGSLRAKRVGWGDHNSG